MNTALSTPPAPGSVSKTGIILATMDEIWRFAETVIASGMAPKGINNAAAATITIQMGMELGLPPMASLQNIAAINGRPSIWGDAMLGVVRSTGELEEFKEWFENNGTKLARTPSDFPDSVMAVCRVKRRGYDAVEASFSVADAKRAKLWGKQGPWTEYTARMLKFRARSFALRDEFGDALRGLYSAEEQRDAPNEMREATGRVVGENTTPPKVITGGTTAPTATEAPAKAKGKAKAEPAATVEAETKPVAETKKPDRATMIADLRTAYRAAGVKTGPEAEDIARKNGYLPEGVSISQLNEADMFRIYENRDTVFIGATAEPAVIHAFYQNHKVTRSADGVTPAWTMHRLVYQVAGEDDVKEAVTFSKTIQAKLDELEGAEAIILTVKSTDKGDQIETLELAQKVGGAA
jgi:hypothetical protein